MTSKADKLRRDDAVRLIMAPRAAAVGADESAASVARELAAGDIGAVLVDTPGGSTGVLSERDIVSLVANGIDIDRAQAGEVMTADLVVADPDQSIESVGRLMSEAGVRHVVVKSGSEIRGIVSIRDVLAVLLGDS